MRATKSSRRSPTSKTSPLVAPQGGAPAWEYVAIAFVLLIIGVLAAMWHHAHGYPLYYGDAESHLNTARRIIDSRTPGYDQIGSPWLPLPHVLMLPFVGNMDLWRTGMAGTIPGVACFVLAGTLLFAVARLILGGFAAGLAAALLFGLNPNILYLQATPMSEPVYLAMIAGVAFFAVRGNPVAAAMFSCGASLTRYEGWALIPVVVLVLLFTRGFRSAFLFGAIASIPPLYWLAHNWWYYGNALEFYNGPYSAKMIYQRAVEANMQRYPGDHDWPRALQYYRAAAKLCAGTALIWIGSLGFLAAIVRRAWWALAILTVPAAFFVVSMYSSGTPIYVPNLWPNTYYNTRYGIAALPLLAFSGAAIVSLIPERWRISSVGVVLALALAPWVAHPGAESWITWKESEVNSVARRTWTTEAAGFFKENYHKGDGIFFSFGDLTGVLREAGIPLRESLYDGNNPHFAAAIARPDLFLWEGWALAVSGDQVSTALLKLGRAGVRYRCVKIVQVKGAPAIEIYRRVQPIPIQ
jgi:hypothetical protein